MSRNVSIQSYLPEHIAAWVQNEAARSGQSRSHWIGSILYDLFQGQDLRDENRQNIEFIKRQLTFIAFALDGLLLEHPDHTLRDRVRDAFRRKMEPEREKGEGPREHNEPSGTA
jgi:hypothetical protein